VTASGKPPAAPKPRAKPRRRQFNPHRNRQRHSGVVPGPLDDAFKAGDAADKVKSNYQSGSGLKAAGDITDLGLPLLFAEAGPVAGMGSLIIACSSISVSQTIPDASPRPGGVSICSSSPAYLSADH
jgi:hypothetical protein